MLHPLLETVSNFVWRIAVPRPWPAEHVRPERSDAAVDRGRISRNNARANLMLAVQSIVATHSHVCTCQQPRIWAGTQEFSRSEAIFVPFVRLLQRREYAVSSK